MILRNHSAAGRRTTLLCTRCGREITRGEEYWQCNGACVCGACLEGFAREELAPYRRTRGKEARL